MGDLHPRRLARHAEPDAESRSPVRILHPADRGTWQSPLQRHRLPPSGPTLRWARRHGTRTATTGARGSEWPGTSGVTPRRSCEWAGAFSIRRTPIGKSTILGNPPELPYDLTIFKATTPAYLVDFPINVVAPGFDISVLGPPSRQTFDRRQRTTYSEQWSVNLQRQLAPDLVMEAGYVGNRGLKLLATKFHNEIIPELGAPAPPGSFHRQDFLPAAFRQLQLPRPGDFAKEKIQQGFHIQCSLHLESRNCLQRNRRRHSIRQRDDPGPEQLGGVARAHWN